jgi:hypothetical protein
MDNVNKQEVWKDIPHYEGLYQISNLGNVWSINNNYLMKPFELKGYLKITLSNKYGKKKQERINRLVALAFLSNPNKYTQVNHIDENKLNNNVNNLEWCSPKYNCNYGTRNQRISESQINDKTKSKSVLQYDKNGDFIKEFPSIKEVERSLGFNHGNISKCCKGNSETCGGFIWRYKN